MSIRKIGLSAAMVTFALLSTMSAVEAGGSRQGHSGHHYRHGHSDFHHYGHGYKKCFHRHDGVRCFWRWR